MEILGKILILGGFGIIIISQLIGTLLVFKASVIKGFLSLVVPGYFLFALKREGLYIPIIGFWVLGVLCVAFGTIAMS